MDSDEEINYIEEYLADGEYDEDVLREIGIINVHPRAKVLSQSRNRNLSYSCTRPTVSPLEFDQYYYKRVNGKLACNRKIMKKITVIPSNVLKQD